MAHIYSVLFSNGSPPAPLHHPVPVNGEDGDLNGEKCHLSREAGNVKMTYSYENTKLVLKISQRLMQ